MRHVTQDGLALVKRFEGFSPTPYLCPANRWTIGFGSLRGIDGLPVTAATAPITSEEADALLARDLEAAERAVLRLIKVPLTDGQFDSLADFAYNLGSGSLQRSTLRAKVNRGEHGDVPGEFLKWYRGGAASFRVSSTAAGPKPSVMPTPDPANRPPFERPFSWKPP